RGRHRPRAEECGRSSRGLGRSTKSRNRRAEGGRMNLLLEIGAEEIPDWMLPGALQYLGGAMSELFKQHQLGGEKIRTDATPRRLVVRAEGIAARQMDSEERVWGPAKSAPEAAVAGFAKKQGIAVEALEV